MTYTITLADGTKLTNLSVNGNNYVSKEKIDEAVFKNNLTKITISDGEKETTMHYVEFVSQVEINNEWYLCFREISENERAITDLQVAIAEIYELTLGGN